MKKSDFALIVEFRKALKASDDVKCQQLRGENSSNQKFIKRINKFSKRFKKRTNRLND